MVELELVLGLVEVEFSTWDISGAELAGWNFTYISNNITSFTILWKSGGVKGLRVVSKLGINVHRALTTLVLIDVVLALVTTAALDLNTQLGEESSDISHELDGLLPGADILIDLVEQVLKTTTGVLQGTFAIVAIV